MSTRLLEAFPRQDQGTGGPLAPQRPHRRRHAWAVALGALLVLTLVVCVWGIGRNPIPADDEGTYLSEAWALLTLGHLSHYTYWYDHPPLGWIVLAGWMWATPRLLERAHPVDGQKLHGSPGDRRLGAGVCHRPPTWHTADLRNARRCAFRALTSICALPPHGSPRQSRSSVVSGKCRPSAFTKAPVLGSAGRCCPVRPLRADERDHAPPHSSSGAAPLATHHRRQSPLRARARWSAIRLGWRPVRSACHSEGGTAARAWPCESGRRHAVAAQQSAQ